ncbi:hypothetical protein [Mucilaginibacter sp. UYCu711]|jgi:hypothetical protein|uniref:hypothetical protein n=1 Tax=Mucilaginibacter sp. UYCu711 TaxID=3156339 RepID=UPI003D1D9507
MSCKFSIKTKQDIAETYQIALREIERFGASYNGDANGGNFELEVLGMRFKGTIQVKSNIIVVNLTDKPMLVPCSLIESSVKSYVDTLQ